MNTGERPTGVVPDMARLPWPSGHPAEPAHSALLQALADHLEAGLIVPCVAAGPAGNAWTADIKGPVAAAAARAAAAACADCPALEQCRQYALEAPEGGGVWGGLTPRERAEQLPRRRPGRPPGRQRAA